MEPSIVNLINSLEQILAIAPTLEDEAQFLAGLSAVSFAKKQLHEGLAKVEELEAQAKTLINDRLKATDPEWTLRESEHYKITRQLLDTDHNISPKTVAKFVKTKKTANDPAIREYRDTHNGKLPAGVSIRVAAHESIKVKT